MSKKTLTVIASFVAAVCVLFRTITLIYATEADTGFFVFRLMPLGVGLTAVCLILPVVMLLFCLSAKSDGSVALTKLTGIMSIAVGLSVIAYCFIGTYEYVIVWQRTLEMISGLICGVWFVLMGLKAFKKFNLPEILSVAPTVHWVFKLIVAFSNFSSNALVAEHVFTLSSISLTCLFMLMYGKSITGFAGVKTKKFIYPVAICGGVLNLTSALSRLAVTLMGKSEVIHGDSAIDLVGIAVGVFMLFVLSEKNNEM
ncbi:MAG: hypothetical protein E7568_03870 [Ruminococcaceae bacterium]|nr:hypothetical protein [Oscillospiraceae bacterium]